MSEAELVEFIYRARETIVGVMQWWASISFALVAVAHFSRNRLNAIVVSVVLLLYVAFSVFSYAVLTDQVNIIHHLSADLKTLAGGDAVASNTLDYLISTVTSIEAGGLIPTLVMIALYLAILGTFIASIAFVLHTYLTHRKSQN